MNALERLETTLASLRKDVPTVRVGGIVSEVAATHYRVSGLSRYVSRQLYRQLESAPAPA